MGLKECGTKIPRGVENVFTAEESINFNLSPMQLGKSRTGQEELVVVNNKEISGDM